MSDWSVFQVTASALEAQRIRMNIIASNMANVNSTRTSEGGPYKRKDVIFKPFNIKENLQGVTVADIIDDNAPFNKIYEPGHPDADPQGYVTLPNVNILEEMVNMIMASKTYEANISAFNITKNIILKTLELGRY